MRIGSEDPLRSPHRHSYFPQKNDPPLRVDPLRVDLIRLNNSFYNRQKFLHIDYDQTQLSDIRQGLNNPQ